MILKITINIKSKISLKLFPNDMNTALKNYFMYLWMNIRC